MTDFQDKVCAKQLEFPISAFFEVHELPEQGFEDNEEERLRQKQALEERLASAEIKRQSSIDQRRAKATKTLKAAEKVVAQQEQLQHDRAARLGAKLEQAERLREQHQAVSAQKLYDMLARAKAISEMAKLREEGRGLKRQSDLDSRLQRAEDARYEKLQIVTSSIALGSSSRVIQKYWRNFVIKRGTTVDRISSFQGLGLLDELENPDQFRPVEQHVDSEGSSMAVIGSLLQQNSKEPDAYERLMMKLISQHTRDVADRLLKRLEMRIPASRRNLPGLSSTLKQAKTSGRRYPTKVFMCVFVILRFPQEIFNSKNPEREANLTCAAETMISAFRQLLSSFQQTVKHHPRRMSTSVHVEGSTRTYEGPAPAQQLLAFDEAWITYLEQFVAHKTGDAAAVEADLIKTAVAFEVSKNQKLGAQSPGHRPQSAADREAIVEQTERDHALLRERIKGLTGMAGVSRMEAGLAAARAASNPSTPVHSTGPSPITSPQKSPQMPLPQISPRPSQAGDSPQPQASVNGTNEALMWELLYNLDFKFPSTALDFMWSDAIGATHVMQEEVPENESAEARSVRISRIADQAFYDNLQDPPPEYIVGLLTELRKQLIDTLPPRNRQIPRLQEALHEAKLLQDISQGSVHNLLPAFDLLANVLMQSGSAERESTALAVHQRIRQDLRDSANDSAQLSAALVRALRIMRSQLHLLSFDTMAFALNSLRSHIRRAESGVEYSRRRFAARLAIAEDASLEDLAQTLPQTRAWLARGASTVPSLQLLASSQAQVQATGSQIPASMQTGRQAIRGSSGSGAVRPAVDLVTDVRSQAWRVAVRASLANLMSEMRSNEKLPETLQLDKGRLRDAKDLYDRMLIISTCILVAQTATSSPSQQVDVTALAERLESMMESADMDTAAITTELASAAGFEKPSPEQISQLETRVQRMLSRGDASYKALTNGLTKVLQKELVVGRSRDAELKADLTRFGAGTLLKTGGVLLDKLAAIAAVTESVHGDTYQKLLSGLI